MIEKSIENQITSEIIGACIEVHSDLGPGLLEAVYEEAVCLELSDRGIAFKRQKEVPVFYKGRLLSTKYRADLIVEDKVIVELKSVKAIEDIHKAQILHYMKLTDLSFGLLINFNVTLLKEGLRRFRL